MAGRQHGCSVAVYVVAPTRLGLLLDEQGTQIFAMTDQVAERTHKLGRSRIKSIGNIARHQRVKDNDHERLSAERMLAELCSDNLEFTRNLRSTEDLCDKHNGVATASLIEVWI